MIPSAIVRTTALPTSIRPTAIPQIPNAIKAGARFGMMLIRPNFTLRNEIAKTAAIKNNAMSAPMIELLMFLSEMWENIRFVDAAVVHIVSGVFLRSHSSD